MVEGRGAAWGCARARRIGRRHVAMQYTAAESDAAAHEKDAAKRGRPILCKKRGWV